MDFVISYIVLNQWIFIYAAADDTVCLDSLVFAATRVSSLIIHDINTQSEDITALTSSRNLRNANSIALDHDEGLLFFTDATLNLLYKQNFRTREATEIVTSFHRLAVPEKIALDTDENTIFMTDSGQRQIVKMDYNGENMETVLTDGLLKPRGIDLDSESRTVYYSDWSSNPHISKVDYSGNNAAALVETDIEEPNALAIAGNRLYWCDAIKDRLYSIKLDGEDRREELFKQGSHFYDIMIHDDLMYITNWYGVGSSEVLQLNYDTDQRLSVVAEYEDTRVNGVTRICYPETPLSSDSSTSTSTTTTITTTTTTTTSTTSTTTTHSNHGIDDSHSSTQALASTVSNLDSNPKSSQNSDSGSDGILFIAVSVGVGGILLGVLIVIITLIIRKSVRKSNNNEPNTKHRAGPLPPALPEPISPDASPRLPTRAATYVKPAQLQNELNPYQGRVYEDSMKENESPYDRIGGFHEQDDNPYMDVIGEDDNFDQAKSADEIYVYIDHKDLNKY